MRLLGVLLVLVGCHGGGSVTPDSSTEPDVPPSTQGLIVTWRAQPSLPGMLTDKIMVTDAVFQLEHLQLVSDASSEHTTHTRLQLEWDSGGSPPDEVFENAPVAHYQQIVLDMRSDARPPFSYAYQIEGTWQDDDDSGKFRIADPAVLQVSVACDVLLPASGSVTVAIRLDLRNALNGINFKSLPMDGGVRVLSSGKQLADLREQLIHHAFMQDVQDD
jgi:hypothetical protein